jgi:hypothetical protein
MFERLKLLNHLGLASLERQYDRNDDHKPQNTLLKIGIDADDVHTIVQHAHQQCTEQGVRRAAGAAGERRASDHHRRNRLQDVDFQGKNGPAQWAQASLIRYADDFVVMARHMSPEIGDFIEQKLEAWLGLKLNREKTRIVNLRRPEERLEFLGYQIGLAPVRADRTRHYWRMEPA